MAEQDIQQALAIEALQRAILDLQRQITRVENTLQGKRSFSLIDSLTVRNRLKVPVGPDKFN
ncbi:hypothetical protein LCGC14_1796460 [marine sediment metagenome]|uniref:Uncharacterized protein n=1 Tax=marine sediment metagenome TaxID=412755 RepID=A0A0F9J5Q7_9ZZZZ